MTKWGGYIRAKRIKRTTANGIIYSDHIVPIITEAYSPQDALRKAMRMCLKRYPSVDGWIEYRYDLISEYGEQIPIEMFPDGWFTGQSEAAE